MLILAAGVPRAFETGDFTVATVGYAVMRVGVLSQWLRAAGAHPEGRRTALRYATGIAVMQVGWIGALWLPPSLGRIGFVCLVAGELFVPSWAERAGTTAWHPHHIAERYGLFTIIVLGESVLSATLGVQAALDAGDSLDDLATTIVGGLLVVFAMWWRYFDQPVGTMLAAARAGSDDAVRGAFLWGYGHFLVFATVAATGAGLVAAELALDRRTTGAPSPAHQPG